MAALDIEHACSYAIGNGHYSSVFGALLMATFHGTIYYTLDSRGTRQEIGKVVHVRRVANETDAAFLERVDSEALAIHNPQSIITIEVEHRDGRANLARITQQPKPKRRKANMTA